MGSIRVTQRLLVDRVLNNISYQSREILALQEQLSTGQKVNRPSDDPLAARRAVRASAEISTNDQYLTNISTATPYLSETETSISTVEDALLRAYELVLQGMNDTNAQLQRDEIAIEINQVLESVLVEANHFTNGVTSLAVPAPCRSRSSPHATPTEKSPPLPMKGMTSISKSRWGRGYTSPSTRPAPTCLPTRASGNVDIFQMLIDMRDNLRASDVDGLTENLGQYEDAQEQTLIALSRLGSVQNRLERIDTNLQDINVTLEQALSDNIDADFAEVMVNLNAQSNAFQASLSAGSRVIQPSMLDYLS